MPIVSGNEPPSGKQKPQSASWAWLIPFLLVFGRPIYQAVRNATAGRVTDQQLIIVGAGVVVLLVVVAIVQRIHRSRTAGATRLPTTYTPPTPLSRPSSDQSFVPSAPHFEPIITGKVLVAGIILAAIMGAIGIILFLP